MFSKTVFVARREGILLSDANSTKEKRFSSLPHSYEMIERSSPPSELRAVSAAACDDPAAHDAQARQQRECAGLGSRGSPSRELEGAGKVAIDRAGVQAGRISSGAVITDAG